MMKSLRLEDYEIKFESRPKVLVTHHDVPKAGINFLQKFCDVSICETTKREEIISKAKGCDAIFWGTHERLDGDILDQIGSSLKCVSTMSVGIDYVDVEALKTRKIPLGYTPNVLNDAVADIGIGLCIAASRRFHEGRLKIEQSKWEKRNQWMLGVELRQSTVGFVGFGGIGQTVAKRLSGFDVKKILYCGHSEKPEAKTKFNAEFVPFLELVEKSDFIFVICPLTSETRKLFSHEIFGRMRKNCVLINIARGDIIDQDALIDALKSGKIFAAGIDVMSPEPLPSDHELLKLDNCVIIPHLGSATVRTRDDMSKTAALNILNSLAGNPMVYAAY